MGCDNIPEQIHFSYTAGEPGALPGTGQTVIEFTDVSNGGNGPSYGMVVNWQDSLAGCDARITQIVSGTKADGAQADAQLCQRMETIAQGTYHPDAFEKLPSAPVAAKYVDAFCGQQRPLGSAPPGALATHVPAYLPPSHAYGAVLVSPLIVSLTGTGGIGALGNERGALVFPEGFHWGERDGQRVVLSADGSIVIRDGEVIQHPAVCLLDGKFYMDKSISVTPAPG